MLRPCMGPPQCEPVEVTLIGEDELFRVVVNSNIPLEFSTILLVSLHSRPCELQEYGGECINKAEKRDIQFS